MGPVRLEGRDLDVAGRHLRLDRSSLHVAERFFHRQLKGPTDPARDAGWAGEEKPRKGFFTDTSICIGCKACEVACKEWNQVPARPAKDNVPRLAESSYDNSEHLGADTWRHVAFIEQNSIKIREARDEGAALWNEPGGSVRPQDLAPKGGCGSAGGCGCGGGGATATASAPVGLADPIDLTDPTGAQQVPTAAIPPKPGEYVPPVRWLMSSDVCKHCTHAACLDVCPTGALFRTEFGTVVVQADVCNGCGYCVAACPFGVIDRRNNGTVTVGPQKDLPGRKPKVKNEGVAQKCTLCYDRLKDDMTPACAHTCPTTSIKFGNHSDMVDLARKRVAELHEQGITEARLYGANPDDGVGGTGSVFLLLDDPEVYGLPPDPVVTTADLPSMFRHAGVAGSLMFAAALTVFGSFGRTL